MKSNRGFSLIELVVVVGLLGIVLTLVFAPIVFSSKSFTVQSEKTSITSDLRYAMDYLTREIRKADVVEVVDNSTINIDSNVYKIDNKNLMKNGEVVIRGIDRLDIQENSGGIKLEIFKTDKKGVEHSLSSTVNFR